MAQETVEIDIRAWLVRTLKNWYWFSFTTGRVVLYVFPFELQDIA